jgi:hypothetical protein
MICFSKFVKMKRYKLPSNVQRTALREALISPFEFVTVSATKKLEKCDGCPLAFVASEIQSLVRFNLMTPLYVAT